MQIIKTSGYRFKTALRLIVLVGFRQLFMIWDSHTVNESQQGHATPLEAASFLTLQNLPRLRKRKRFDNKLRKYIKSGFIRRGVLANGYPEFTPRQKNLFEGETEPTPAGNTQDLASLIEEVNTVESDQLPQNYPAEFEDEEYEYDDRPLFIYGLVTGIAVTLLLPLWMWLSPQLDQYSLLQKNRYSPQVIQVAAARGQDCARSKDLYSQLYCGELWRKELNARVDQHYTDLLAVSSAIDSLHQETGFEIAQPLANRVQDTHNAWSRHLEESCNTAAAVENLGAKRGNRYLDCVHSQLIARESEIREQLNYLRGLGWHEQADDALNNELIAIRNMAATVPATPDTENTQLEVTEDASAEEIEQQAVEPEKSETVTENDDSVQTTAEPEPD